MNLPVKENVVAVLSRLEPILHSIIMKAWGDWLLTMIAHRFERTRTTVLWEFIIRRADEAFCDDPGIERKERFATVSYIIDESVLIRFKKGDRNKFSRNIPTQRAMAFNDHSVSAIDMVQGLLFEDAYPSRVEVVYIMNKSQTDIDKIFVIAKDKNKIIWDHEINPLQAVVQEFPAFTQTKTPPSSIVVPKIPDAAVNIDGGGKTKN